MLQLVVQFTTDGDVTPPTPLVARDLSGPHEDTLRRVAWSTAIAAFAVGCRDFDDLHLIGIDAVADMLNSDVDYDDCCDWHK